MNPLLPYIIIACAFGAFATGIFLVARAKGWGESFPGKLYSPLIAIAVLFSIASMTSVIIGAEEEKKHKEHEAAEKAHENGGEAPAGVERTSEERITE